MLKVTVSGKVGEGKSSLVEHIRIALVKLNYSVTVGRISEDEARTRSAYATERKQSVTIIEENNPT